MKVKNGHFSDNRIKKLHEYAKDSIREKAIELQLPMASVIGVVDNIKHELQHEFLVIDPEMIEF